METIIALFCIFGLCIFIYSYQMMRRKYKDYNTRCNVFYIPEHDTPVKNRLPHMEVLDHEEHDAQFIHSQYETAPQGLNELDNLMPNISIRYNSQQMREFGR